MGAVELSQKPPDGHADLEAGDERSRRQGQSGADQSPQRLSEKEGGGGGQGGRYRPGSPAPVRGGGMTGLDSSLEGR